MFPGDLQLGDWYSKYVPSEEVVASNRAKGWTEDWAVWEVYIYIYT